MQVLLQSLLEQSEVFLQVGIVDFLLCAFAEDRWVLRQHLVGTHLQVSRLLLLPLLLIVRVLQDRPLAVRWIAMRQMLRHVHAAIFSLICSNRCKLQRKVRAILIPSKSILETSFPLHGLY